jgi:hypothetical protein
MAAWWRKRSTGEQISILSLLVAVIGSIIVPIYLNTRQGDRASPASTTISNPSTTATPTTLADPLVFALEDNPARIPSFDDFGEDLVIPRGQVIEGGPGQGCGNFHPWGTRLGGVPAGYSYLRLVVQGREARPILLSGMRARIVDRQPPLAGTQLTCPSAGDAQIKSIEIDLDGPSTEAVYKTPTGVKPFGFTIAKNETVVFDVQIFTKKCHCKWFLELDLVIDGVSRTQTIGDDGQPFEITTRSDRSYEWDYQNTWALTDSTNPDAPIYEPQPRDKPLTPLS